MKKLLLLLLFTASAYGQVSNPSIISVSTAPSGACSAGLPNQQVITTGTQYSCQSGTWAAIGGGGTGTVTSVTFTGDGTILSSTPSTAVTTSGTLNATLATQTANTVLGALTATTPSRLAVPSCSTANSGLNWTSGTGFGCDSSLASLSSSSTQVFTGNIQGPALISATGFQYGTWVEGTSSASQIIERTNADAYAAVQIQGSGTGDIAQFENGSTLESGFTIGGIPYGNVGGAIASATTIAPVAPRFHVTGTTSIATITPPTGCTTASMSCQITIIPDGSFATTTAGNIALISTAVVSKALIMTYDPATSKWYPSY